MADHYIVGVIASLLWLLFFYYKSLVTGLKKTRSKFPTENCTKITATREAGGTTDIIIVGAGVAGSALAYSLGKDGRRVRLIERDLNAPDRIAGEALVTGGYLKLIELGLEDCVDEIDAQPNRGFVLYKDGMSAKVAFPLEKFQPHVAGRNFHNGRFVQRLREKAASLDNVSLEQGTVTCLLEENGTVKGVHYKTKSGQELTAFAPLTIVCDGSFSNLRRSFCNTKVDVPSYFVAVTLKNCKLPKPGFANIILGDPLFLFYPHSSTELRCMVDVQRQNLPSGSDGDQVAHYLKTSVAPRVPPEFYSDFISAIENKNNIRIAQTRSMPAAPIPSTPGALLIGDALNMRHPIVGGGMTVALSDVVLVRDLLRPLHNLNDPSAICKYLEYFYTLRKPMASTVNTLVSVLYKVLSPSTDPAMEAMQRACVGYMNLGGICSNGLSGLISGLYPRPLTLAFHFSGMAIYGVGQLLLPFPSPKRMRIAARCISVGIGILVPLIKTEGFRPMFFPQTVPAYHRTPPASATNKNPITVSSLEKRIPTD